ncbi:hypothetical protein SAMN04488543_0755 [Friedmanniella luteola]|uniref:Transcriptional regulator, AbiEi antitoxin, Type IV TA system n=1 Tax=Friedmanniella luteola TaxID=546871 RepID=A0A1H1MZR4_9ACTN|nr:hypothetical protein [Friedmanniella luteola]SDR92226.1 hypothetical protein SAMN04488543_0755 [Friedmanniella luteola]
MRADDDVGRHRQLLQATVPQLGGGVVSHLSAAVLHGLPLPVGGLRHVQVTQPAARSGRRRGHVHRFAAPLPAEDVTLLDGLAVTTLARTVVDLGRALPFADAVAVADAALRQGLDGGELRLVLEQATGRPGVARARRVVAFADGRSESAGESRSRVLLHRIGLPPSTLQLVVLDEQGCFVGRSDFGWQEHRTLGEFDGRVTYGRLLRPGETAADVVHREKRREDALRDQGWEMVRWGSVDLHHEQALAERLRRAFRRGDARAPRG